MWAITALLPILMILLPSTGSTMEQSLAAKTSAAAIVPTNVQGLTALAAQLTEVGLMHLQRHECKLAQECFRCALEADETANGENPTLIAADLTNLIAAHLSEDDYVSAEPLIHRLLNLAETDGRMPVQVRLLVTRDCAALVKASRKQRRRILGAKSTCAE